MLFNASVKERPILWSLWFLVGWFGFLSPAAARKHPCFLFPSFPSCYWNKCCERWGSAFWSTSGAILRVHKENQEVFCSESLLLLSVKDEELNSWLEGVLLQEGRACMTLKWNTNYTVLGWAQLEWELHVLVLALLRNAYGRRTRCLLNFHRT